MKKINQKHLIQKLIALGLFLLVLIGQSTEGDEAQLFPAAAAKSLQSCPTLCDPMDSSPPGSSAHRIL